jgi:hypothetical protein
MIKPSGSHMQGSSSLHILFFFLQHRWGGTGYFYMLRTEKSIDNAADALSLRAMQR